LMYDQTPAGIRESKTGISGSRSCTKSQTGVFASWTYERLSFYRSADTQRLSVTGPPPTCPFI